MYFTFTFSEIIHWKAMPVCVGVGVSLCVCPSIFLKWYSVMILKSPH